MSARRALLGLVRIVIGGGLIALLVSRSDGAIDVVLREDLPVVFLATGAYLAALAVGALRWRTYLLAFDVRVGARATSGLAAGGAFFNAFLPTGVGGDAFKALRLVRAGYERTAAFGSVLLDRLAGLIGLAIIGAVAAVTLVISGEGDSAVPLLTLLVALAIVGGEAGLALAGALLARIAPQRFRARVREITGEVRLASRHPARVIEGYGLGVAAQVLIVVAHLTLASALGFGGEVAIIVCAVALAQVAALIPVTINGLGLREGVYVWVLTGAGVPRNVAVVFGLMNLGAVLLASLIAGGVYLIGGARIEPVSSSG